MKESLSPTLRTLLDELERLEDAGTELEEITQHLERLEPLSDGVPTAVGKLVSEFQLLRAEHVKLQKRCGMLKRALDRWAEAARRETPTDVDLETARNNFVECKIRQDEAPPGSIMRRVCDAAVALVNMLESRDDVMRSRIVEMCLEIARLKKNPR